MKEKIQAIIDRLYPSSKHKSTVRGAIRLGASICMQELAKELQPAPLRPLRELAEDKEMCEEIAKLLGGKFTISEYDPNVKNKGYVDIRYIESINEFKRVVSFYEDGYVSFPDAFIENAFQVFALISSRYKIGE